MSAPSRASLPQTTFTDAEGQPLANGYLEIQLSKDVQVPILNLQLVSGRTCHLPLDNDGNITGSGVTFFYPNSELAPDDSVYILRAFSAQGQLVSDEWIIVTTGGSFGFGSAFGVSWAS